MTHDPAYKKLFSQPRMIEDLLRGFVDQPWIDDLDFTTLEQLNRHFVTPQLGWRESDIIWRAQFRRNWLYVIVLLEFQSRPDRYMALRMCGYLCLLYLDLIDQKQTPKKGKLPPVLPIVLYNGSRRWRQPTALSELIDTLPGLAPYQPRFEFLLLDESRYPDSALNLPQNIVAALFRLEHSREPHDILEVLRIVLQELQQSPDQELDAAFLAWLKPLLVRAQFPEQQLDDIDQLYEVEHMLAERIQAWTRQWKQEGFQQGIEQGIEQGIAKGLEDHARATLRRQLTQRFGALPTSIDQRIEKAEQTQLDGWLDHVISAPSLESIFGIDSLQ